jgi:hypothetical protein
MHLLYCDESNLEERSSDFFVYGGLIIPPETAKQLSNRIGLIRTNAGVARDFILKFNPGPAGMSHTDFVALKQQVLQCAVDHGCKFITSLILHDIATSPDDARRNEINRICYHFNCYLNPIHATGLVLIDRFSDSQIDAHLCEKFSTGLTGMPYGDTLALQHIVGFHYSAIGQSHYGSVVDIVLGSFRFAVNAFTRNDQSKAGTSIHLLQLLRPLFDTQANGEILETSLFLSPKVIRVERYRNQYEALKRYFADNGLVMAQDITANRNY